jgi:hypothetical protein
MPTRCRAESLSSVEIWYGSGDHEDPPEIAEDQSLETFEILFTSAGNPGAW